MKRKLLISAILGWGTIVGGATGDLSTNLQKGLFEEEASHNLNAAIEAYQSVVTQFDKDRQLAGTAVFRLGECYRKQANTNAASALYERVLHEFSDQPQLVTLSRQQLAALGRSPSATAPVSVSDASRQEQKRLIDEEIQLLETRLASQQKQIENGTSSAGELLPTQREILKLKRQAAALTAALPELLSIGTGAGADADEVRRIQDLIVNSPDLINAPDKDGLTLLQRAAAKGELGVVTLLLESGAAVNGLKQPELTPLHYAAGNGHKAVVDLLLSKGARVDASTQSGVTPLHLAARNGYAVIVKTLLEAGAPVEARVTQSVNRDSADLSYSFSPGWTPLHAAADSGQQAVVELLVAKGADVNAVDGQGRTPLSYAVSGRSSSVAKTLLEAKADPDAGGRDLPLGTSAVFGDVEMMRQLLAKGADPNKPGLQQVVSVPGGFARLPLSLAVLNRHPAAVAELIKAKADPNAIDVNNSPILFEALSDQASANDSAALQALLDGGADANRPAKSGDGPLQTAIAAGNLPAVRLLLEHGADPNARNAAGETPLHLAVLGGRKDIAELLLAKGADVNAADNQGQTPLAALAAVSARFSPRSAVPRPGIPMPIPGAVFLPGTASDRIASPPEISDLLRSHGAVADLPDFSSIRVTPQGGPAPWVVFHRDTNGLNRFTLLEVIGTVFARDFERAGFAPQTLPPTSTSFPFPDFSRIKIHRPAQGQPAEPKEIAVNLLTSSGNLDGAKDLELQFGDVVEIPEREHPLSERAVGLTNAQWEELKKCLARKVTFIVKGQPTEVPLPRLGDSTYLSRALGLPEVRAVLRSSSDLSHLRVKRSIPGTAEVRELTQDVMALWRNPSLPFSDDLWLRAGDVIEVPDKP